jgi:PHP family Zn ribbon phosphoesterase
MELVQIKESIYEVRGQKIILDYDLAKMYHVETKYLKRTVRTHYKRFPSDFMFELTKEEWENLRCRICTSKVAGGIRYRPFAFSEQGIEMRSVVL